jgi:CTP:molybdopterin cytidylyltransferase MocA/GNAT superfamily N-acetyltransferase
MIDPAKSAAVITAAGASSRMGRLKALLDWGGKSLLQHQIDELAGFGQVIVVLGYEAALIAGTLRLPANVRVVNHADWAEGRASSLRAGFAAIAGSPEAVLVTGVDQPIDAGALAALLAVEVAGTAVIVPTVVSKRGHPVLFTGDLLGELRGITEQTEGLREVLKRHAERVVEVPVSAMAPIYDFNLPEEYYRARKPELDRAISRIPELPVHTTRRSLALYTRKLTELFAAKPHLAITAPDVYISATPVEANHSVWINFGAENIEALAREMPQAWARIKATLSLEHEWKAEIWLSHANQEPIFTALGWRIASRMVRYNLKEILTYPSSPFVREYEPQDFEQLLAIHRASSAPTEQLSEEAYQDLLVTVDRTAVFIEDGKLLGYTHVQIVDDTGLFQGLAVDPNAQGKGVGKALVYEALNAMRERGAVRVELLALEEAIPARRLYEKVGFHHIADQLWMDCEFAAASAEATVPAAGDREKV